MSCPCPSPSPSPSCTPLNTQITGDIAMYFGTIFLSGVCTNCSTYEALSSGILDSPLNYDKCVNAGGTWVNGNFTKVFASVGEDFTLEFSANDLIEAGILPQWDTTQTTGCSNNFLGAATINGTVPYNDLPIPTSTLSPINKFTDKLYPFDKFILSEQELLSTGSFETWISWCVLRWACFDGTDIDCSLWKNMPFGLKAIHALGLPVENTVKAVTEMLVTAKVFNKPDSIGSLSNIIGSAVELWNNFVDISDPISATNRKVFYAQQYEKLVICYQWIKSIYETYYGKQFLVKIGNKTPADSHVPFKGICVKNAEGEYPAASSFPLVVKGDGSSQDLFLSDQISSDGGYPLRSTTNILGLKLGPELNDVRTEDGRITCFVKFGYVRQFLSPSGVWSPVYINKFGYKFIVDLGSMSESNYFIVQQDNYEVLYIKATVSDEIYFLNNPEGQWARISLNEMVPLSLYESAGLVEHGAQSIAIFLGIISLDAITAFKALTPDPSNVNQRESIPFGGKQTRSQVNIVNMQRMTAMPFGAVIPMKSNLFTYGPYFYDGSNGSAGGVDVIKDNSLCPWNYDKTAFNQISNPETVYHHMDCVGKALAKDGVMGLQYLEKGTVTIEALPSYNIGYSVNITPSGILGPTLVTDIAVDFGSGGVNSSYNFQTYTPRVGRPARYLVDAWAESIKKIQMTNAQLKEEKARADNLKVEYNNKIINERKSGPTYGALYERTPLNKYSHTPSKILISGYYMMEDIDINSRTPPASEEPLPSVSVSPSPSVSCKPCGTPIPSGCNECNCPSASPSVSPSESPLPSNPYPSVSGNINRLYSFAEHHEAYSQEYVQNTYKQIAIMSLDGLFLPVSLLGDGIGQYSGLDGNGSPTGISTQFNNTNLNRIARFAVYSSLSGSTSDVYPLNGISKSRDSLPPINFYGSYSYNLAINQTFLNPMLSKRMLTNKYIDDTGSEVSTPKNYGWLTRASNTTNGFVISNIAFGNSFEKYQYNNIDEEEFIKQNQENFRFSAHRGPLVVQGWGYDTDGKPIPNYADSPVDTERGFFKRNNLTDKFMPNWIQNPRTWPVGPVDLRFDRERGVWTCAPPNKILVAKLIGTLSANGTADATLLDNEEYYSGYSLADKDGRDMKRKMSNTKIKVKDYLGKSYPSGSIIYVYYAGSTNSSDNNKYIVLDGNDKSKVKIDPTTGIGTITDEDGIPCCENNCWPPDLDILKAIKNYKPDTKQALIHTASSGLGCNKIYPPCLSWEDIIDCDPSPSPPANCSCDSLTLNNLNGGRFTITFPYPAVKNVYIQPQFNLSVVDGPTECFLPSVEIDCSAAGAVCIGDDVYELVFDISYDRCCEDYTTSTPCCDTITMQLSVDNFPAPSVSPGPSDCDCDTGDNCNWTIDSYSTTNCDEGISITLS